MIDREKPHSYCTCITSLHYRIPVYICLEYTTLQLFRVMEGVYYPGSVLWASLSDRDTDCHQMMELNLS